MNTDDMALNEPTVVNEEVAEELAAVIAETEETVSETSETVPEDGVISTEETLETDAASESVIAVTEVEVEFPEDYLDTETYLNGVDMLLEAIDPESVPEDEAFYVDSPALYALDGSGLPDYAVIYQADGVDVIFPTSYAEQILIQDGLLINLGSSYTAGVQLSGYSVDNYLSSEITIPTYHSSTWYQYLQTYGQPYRVVDRYVNSYGNISSSTRSSVSLTWSGGNPWEGFTFEKVGLFIIIAILLIIWISRKGGK